MSNAGGEINRQNNSVLVKAAINDISHYFDGRLFKWTVNPLGTKQFLFKIMGYLCQ